MITQRDVGAMLAQFITELVTARLEPQQTQLAEVLQKVREKVDPKPAVVSTSSSGRLPKAVSKKRGVWPPAAPPVVAKTASKGGRPKGGYKIPKAEWASLPKQLAKEGVTELSKKYDVTPQTIYNYINRL
jgi:hypothetical protein